MNATLSALTAIVFVNPVPWARAQMAFTLAFHIILVPLGVSWAFMTLIANYRGLRHNDRDALMLAQRWSKYMAVTFAVGAVTGTVLTFEFGLLWPRFMGQWGEAFGVPFAFEGLFFFTEAIFIAIYIFGWRRLKPWAHFWTGVPIVLAGIFGSISVVAANAWMNAPAGFTLDSNGHVVQVDPIQVIFNESMPWQAAHMLVAAYLVGGFLIASVYAVGMLRGRRDRYHYLGFVIAFTVGPSRRRSRLASAMAWLVGCITTNRKNSLRSSWCQRPAATSPRRSWVISTPTARSPAASRSPAWRRGCPIPARARRRWCRALTQCRRTTDRPSPETNIVHLCWDIMVGFGTALFLLAVWYALSWIFRRRMPQTKWFLRAAAVAGPAAVITLEAGWIVTEVGRQPWIVYNIMKVEDAVTANTGVWIMFFAVVILYAAVGTTTILILRRMSRRFRRGGGFTDLDTPYGPSALAGASTKAEETVG